ncbi:MAG: hypothetical protein QOH64_3183 [Acidimicrobiaceae bacterium]|jgi:hypothetical protein
MVGDVLLLAYVLSRSAAHRITRRFAGDERGEGVISTAIAVLIVAFLGVAAYVIFRGVLDSSGSKASLTVDQIGGDGGP